MAERNLKLTEFERFLVVLMTGVLVVVFFVVGFLLFKQLQNYDAIMNQELFGRDPSGIFLLTLAKSLDATIVGSTTTFFSFILILLGTLIVFRTIDVEYEASVTRDRQFSLNLKSTSPGLIIATLGVIIIVVVNIQVTGNVRFAEPGEGAVIVKEGPADE